MCTGNLNVDAPKLYGDSAVPFRGHVKCNRYARGKSNAPHAKRKGGHRKAGVRTRDHQRGGGQGIYRFLQQGKAVLCPRLPYPRPMQGEILETETAGRCRQERRRVTDIYA